MSLYLPKSLFSRSTTQSLKVGDSLTLLDTMTAKPLSDYVEARVVKVSPHLSTLWLLSNCATIAEKIRSTSASFPILLRLERLAQDYLGMLNVVDNPVLLKNWWTEDYSNWCPMGLKDHNLHVLKVVLNQEDFSKPQAKDLSRLEDYSAVKKHMHKSKPTYSDLAYIGW
jgi:general stress protein 26